jgi:hypothetical protein
MLNAYRDFVKAAAAHVAQAAGRATTGPAESLLYMGFVRLVQLGYTLETLARSGLVREGQGTARSMVSVALDVLLITEQDTPARALLFALGQRPIRRVRFKVMPLPAWCRPPNLGPTATLGAA